MILQTLSEQSDILLSSNHWLVGRVLIFHSSFFSTKCSGKIVMVTGSWNAADYEKSAVISQGLLHMYASYKMGI